MNIYNIKEVKYGLPSLDSVPTRKNPHFPTGLVPSTTNTAKIIGTNLRNKKKQNINQMRARVGLILRIGWILNEIPAVVYGILPGIR